MPKFGFKELTLENWQEPDEVMSLFVQRSVDGNIRRMEANDWLREIFAPTLENTVPDEVQQLFEVARGACVYGYCFYPLYTLAQEQLFRVAETALAYKCEALKAPRRQTKDFEKKIDYLIGQKVIPEAQKVTWHRIRNLRNMTSHPQLQSIIPPGNVVATLRDIADRINTLFDT